MLFITIFAIFSIILLLVHFLIFTPSKSYYKIRTFRDFKLVYENLCWKQSKQIGKRVAREAFLLSICLRSFFPIRPLVRLCGKRTSLEENVGAIDVWNVGAKHAYLFFFFFFSIMLFLTRKNHRRSDWWKS